MEEVLPKSPVWATSSLFRRLLFFRSVLRFSRGYRDVRGSFGTTLGLPRCRKLLDASVFRYAGEVGIAQRRVEDSFGVAFQLL